MKKVFVIILGVLFLTSTLFATLTRVKSLGDTENPINGKISGLIKDDIVDIYFNPAKVNEVKALLIISSFNIDYGTDNDEVYEYYNITEATKTNITLTKTTREGYDFQFNTGILIPIKMFNLFINYQPKWTKYYKETSNSSSSDEFSTEVITDTEKRITMDRAAFDVTMGFNIKDRLLFGLRIGYYNSEHNGYSESGGIKKKKSEYICDKFLVGSGVEFNFTKNISLSIAGDFTFSQKDESPLYIEEGILGTSTNEFNYDSTRQLYAYSRTEKEANYGLRIYPEIKLKQGKFIRTLLGIDYYTYSKDYNFNSQGKLAGYDIRDFNKQKVILSSGISFNHTLAKSTRGVYGLKYIGLISGYETKVRYPDNVKSELNTTAHFIGTFVGFDTRISKIIFIRTGLSQGIYKYENRSVKDNELTSGNITETVNISKEILPQTIFALGFYIQPIADLILEFNFSASKDWNMKNISLVEETYKENGKDKERTKRKNYDFQIGLSVSYQI